MDCPRCGFNQPDDKYCANCGLDVETFNARPKPLWKRILQDQNFYAFLFGGILVFLAGYIFLNQRTVGQQMGKLLRNPFVMSRDAADPNEVIEKKSARNVREVAPPPSVPARTIAPTPVQAVPKEAAAPTYSHMEVGFFELSKENMTALNGKVLRDDGDWRVMYFEDASTIESLIGAAGKLPGTQEKSLEKNAIEIDAGDLNPDMQSPYLAVGVDWVKNENLHWAIGLQAPASAASNIRGVATLGTPTDGSPKPITLEGTSKFSPGSALLLVYDPVNRNPASQDLARLAQSPLKVFTSEDFRMGDSALIVWIRLK